MGRKSICVVVLGDIGRSPRMQYHSLSLAEAGHTVDVVGYFGATPIESLRVQPLVSFHYLLPYPSIPLPRLLTYILKTIWQALTLLFVLTIIRKPDFILVQNPPAVPALLVCYLHKLLCGAKLIVDWHNYAHSIMALAVGAKHPLVRATQKIEEYVGVRADGGFCVTKEMKDDLAGRWKISATTLYDRPPDIFRPSTLTERHDLFVRLGAEYPALLSERGTVFTYESDGTVHLKDDRPGLLVSSTSWTEDEDFGILFEALKDYERAINEGNVEKLPHLICVITGRGPLKEHYRSRIAAEQWRHVQVFMPWLEIADYPRILGSADLGVCLHTSSSGLDLPMKVVDMFGCGLPVCAYNFRSLHELVRHEVNGFVFESESELSRQIRNWFERFPHNEVRQRQAAAFKAELEVFQKLRWRENWTMVANPMFR